MLCYTNHNSCPVVVHGYIVSVHHSLDALGAIQIQFEGFTTASLA